MSRVLSFRDLKLIPELSKYTEVEMLSIALDCKVNTVLGQFGFSLNAPILYVPTKHRDLQGNAGVGFRAVGQINNDPIYRESRLCPIIERLIWAAQKDVSLARELAKMIGHSVSLEVEGADEEGSIPDEWIEPDFEIIARQIEALTALRDGIRGYPYNEQGSLKTPNEYQGQN